MSSFLITGGAGFIGSHLAEALVRHDQRVVVLDDLSTGNIKNVSHLRSSDRFELVVDSVATRTVLDEAVDAADVIFHLAARVGVFNIIENPVATILNNIGGTEAVLKAAAKKKKKVILASTSEVYGKSANIPFREDDDVVLGPSTKSRWTYAGSKLLDEFLALSYWRQFKVPTVIVRFFNTIGPRQTGRYGMVVPRFVTQALSSEDLTVYGHGSQSRCFTDVSDVVEWLLRLASRDEAVGEVFNLGNPQEVTIRGLAEKIIQLTESTSNVSSIPYEDAYTDGFEDMQRRVPDIAKVSALTGYLPQYSLDQSLRRIMDWMVAEQILQESKAFSYPCAVATTPEGEARHKVSAG